MKEEGLKEEDFKSTNYLCDECLLFGKNMEAI